MACRRSILLGSTALIGAGLLFASGPSVQAACEIGGQVVNAADPLVNGDNLVCNDIDLVDPIAAAENGVTITFGDGNGAADTTITLNAGDNNSAITILSESTATINADAAITAPNSVSDGVRASGDNNHVTVNGGTFNVGNDGLSAEGDTNAVTVNGGTFVAGDNGIELGGSSNAVTVNGGTFNAADDGIFASGGNNTVTVNNGTLTAGERGINVRSNDNTITVSGGTITTGSDGFNNNGIFADGSRNTITVSGGSISTSSDFSRGIDVGSAGVVTVSGGEISATGASGNGIFASGGGNTITLSGGTVSATGQNARAVSIAVGDGTVDTLILGTGASVTGDLFATNEVDNDGSVSLTSGIANLVLNGNGNGVFNDAITGFQTLTKRDGGSFTLGGTITGASTIDIDAGALAVDGDASASAVNVNSGGTLGGTGTVGATTVGDGGTLAAGNSVGTLTVNNDLAFRAGSLMEVEIDNAGNVDLVQARGDVQIDGGTVRILSQWTGEGLAAASILDASFTFLTAGGTIAGTFDQLDVVDDFVFLDGALDVDPAAISLIYARNNVAFADLAQTDNQRAAAAAAESAGQGNDLFNTVAVITEAEVADTFAALTSDAHASVQAILLQESSATRNRVTSELNRALAAEAPTAGATATYGYGLGTAETGLTVWGGGYGMISELDSDGNASAVDSTAGGFLAGVGKTNDHGLHAGVFAGYGRSDISVDDQAFDADVDTYTVGAYAGRRFERLRFQLGAAYSLNDISTERTAQGGPFNETLTTDYDAHTAQAFGELGYRLDTALAAFEPFAGLAHVAVFSDGFTEQGGQTALTADSQTEAVTYTNLGVRMERRFRLGSKEGRVHGLAGWQHAFGDSTASLEQAFVAGGDAFTVFGAPIAEDAVLLEAGMDLQLSGRAALGLGYNGRIGDGDEQHSFSGWLSLKY